KKPLRVLIVDDTPGKMMIASVFVESKVSKNITKAKDGVQAVEAYKKAFEEGNPFDVVVMDYNMGGTKDGVNYNGDNAIKEIRKFEKEKGIANDHAFRPIIVLHTGDSIDLFQGKDVLNECKVGELEGFFEADGTNKDKDGKIIENVGDKIVELLAEKQKLIEKKAELASKTPEVAASSSATESDIAPAASATTFSYSASQLEGSRAASSATSSAPAAADGEGQGTHAENLLRQRLVAPTREEREVGDAEKLERAGLTPKQRPVSEGGDGTWQGRVSLKSLVRSCCMS
ncbi:response regulator, partial [Rickettsiales bacterium]|nr:response regulator [Rickettsiales bacterium]